MSRPFFFGGPQPAQQASPYLVSFKAGKLTKATNSNTVTPIKDKKGLVYLHQSSEDSLMHFCWKDRVSGQVEEDLIIFPDDAEFVRVPQCTTGRVFVLKFKTSPRRLFFWSQEPKDDKDEEYVNKINEYINNPPAARGGGGGGGGMLSPSDLSLNPEDELRNLFSNPDMSTQQLMSMLGNVRGLGGPAGLASLLSGVSPVSGGRGGSGASSTTPAAPQTPSTTPAVTTSSSTTASESSTSTTGGTNSPATAPTGPGSIRLQDLQSIISGISAQQGGSGGGGQGAEEVSVDLSSSVNIEVLRPLLTNDAFMQRVREKLPPVTGGAPPTTTPQVAEQFVATVQSPQFRQALDAFSAAVQSGQLGPVIQQFGLSEECVAAANNGSLEGFCRALQKSKQPSEAAKKPADAAAAPSTPKKDDKHEDDSMALD